MTCITANENVIIDCIDRETDGTIYGAQVRVPLSDVTCVASVKIDPRADTICYQITREVFAVKGVSHLLATFGGKAISKGLDTFLDADGLLTVNLFAEDVVLGEIESVSMDPATDTAIVRDFIASTWS